MTRQDLRPRRRLDPDARRSAILDAATAAFAARPYDQVSVAALATDAGASEALVYRYFSGKAELHGEVVRAAVEDLDRRRAAAEAALPPGAPARERVRARLLAVLDHLAERPAGPASAWTPVAVEPAAGLHRAARERDVEVLRALLLPDQGERHEYALVGFAGFTDDACRRWVARGCPQDERGPLVEAALGALEGALGDWGR